MVKIEQKGNYERLDNYLVNLHHRVRRTKMEKFGEEGVRALQEATPVNTGKTASSWYYTIEDQNGVMTISFHNSNIVKYVNIALILQYGHATKNGGWVEGVDYINPALAPVFNKILKSAWEEIIKL